MWAVIPVKQISQAKQRLSKILSSEERRDFFSAMLEDVLNMMVKIDFFEKIHAIPRNANPLLEEQSQSVRFCCVPIA